MAINLKEYEILVPDMAEIHFAMTEKVFRQSGYHLTILKNNSKNVVTEGLKYVHNDTCYPALLVIGQLIDALNSGKYDINKTAVMITQTGGGCRASNYIHLLRKAMKTAGYENVPVVSLNMSGLEKESALKLTIPLLKKIFEVIVYGDMVMLLANQVRPYEVRKGETNRLIGIWINRVDELLKLKAGRNHKEVRVILDKMVADFAKIEQTGQKKTKVGIVGEIYVKYSRLGNNNLEGFLETQDCEYMVPGLLAFMMFKIDNRLEDIKLYGGGVAKKITCDTLFNYTEKMENAIIEAVKAEPKFTAPGRYAHLKELVKGIIGHGNKMGEGWLLTAEILDLCELGYENVVCTQPFGCLPNHINGKGMIRSIKSKFPQANVVPIDYDPSASKVNQENRIKLMLAISAQ